MCLAIYVVVPFIACRSPNATQNVPQTFTACRSGSKLTKKRLSSLQLTVCAQHRMPFIAPYVLSYHRNTAERKRRVGKQIVLLALLSITLFSSISIAMHANLTNEQKSKLSTFPWWYLDWRISWFNAFFWSCLLTKETLFHQLNLECQLYSKYLVWYLPY